jgi:hypothetical protein
MVVLNAVSMFRFGYQYMMLTRNYHQSMHILDPVVITTSSKLHLTTPESRSTRELTKQSYVHLEISCPHLTERTILRLSPSLCMRALQFISVPLNICAGISIIIIWQKRWSTRVGNETDYANQ